MNQDFVVDEFASIKEPKGMQIVQNDVEGVSLVRGLCRQQETVFRSNPGNLCMRCPSATDSFEGIGSL
jgi:hypothetical protein